MDKKQLKNAKTLDLFLTSLGFEEEVIENIIKGIIENTDLKFVGNFEDDSKTLKRYFDEMEN